MRRIALLILAPVLALSGVPRAAEEPARGAIVCDDLVALRRLMAEAPNQDGVRQHLPGHPGCRAVDPAGIGEVERRAMIGGAPFECVRLGVQVGTSNCSWLLP